MIRIVRTLFRYLVVRPWALWVGVAVPALLLILANNLPSGGGVSNEERATVVGILELAGLALIAWGYADLRAEFGRPSIPVAFKTYFREFHAALRAPKAVYLRGTAMGTMSLPGSATAVLRPGPNSSLERRMEILEGEVARFREDISYLRAEGARRYEELRKDFEEKHRRTEQGLKEVRGLLENAAIGSPGVEVLGWLWLLAGIIISSAPSFLAVMRAAP